MRETGMMAVLIVAIFWLGLYPRPVLNTTGPLWSSAQYRELSSRGGGSPSGSVPGAQRQPGGVQGEP